MDRTAVEQWIVDHAHRLITLDPSAPFADLEPFRQLIGDARVVAVGENLHRVHEFYNLRHRLVRFLVTEMGFTAFVMESGFPEAVPVDDWVTGGPGSLDRLLVEGITYHMGKCAEMRDQLDWMRRHNQQSRPAVRFYGMDLPDSSASARPAINACLAYLTDVDPPYAERLHTELTPLFDYLPDDRSGLAWAAPALMTYPTLQSADRHRMTALISELAERMQAMEVTYGDRSDPIAAGTARRCAATARHMDAFLAALAQGPERTYEGANHRDAAMAENMAWILEHHDRVVVAAANGHIARWPFTAPPFITDPLTTLGEHLHAALGESYRPIGTTFSSGDLWAHRPAPGAEPGHTTPFVEPMGPLVPSSLDALMSTAGIPRFVLDFADIPENGPIADGFSTVDSIMTGPQPQPVDPRAAFDGIVHIDRISPWHTTIETRLSTAY